MLPKRRVTQAYFEFAIEKYSPLMRRIVSSLGGDHHQQQEFQHVAIEELLKCMICFDRNGGGSFVTFFYGRVCNICRHIKKRERKAKRVQFIDDIESVSLSRYSYTPVPEGVEQIEEYLEGLSQKERFIIIELFVNSKTIAELSRETGIGKATISAVKFKALRKMKQHVNG